MATLTLDIAANKAAVSLGSAVAKIADFSHTFINDYSEIGNQVKIPIVKAAPAASFDEATNNYEGTTTSSTATIPLSVHIITGFKTTQMELADGLGKYTQYFENLGEAAGRSVATKMEQDCVELVTATSVTNIATLEPTKAGFADLINVCVQNDIDISKSTLVLNPATYASLIAIAGGDIVNLDEVYRTGVIRNLLGFKSIIMSKFVDEDLVGFIAEEGSICFASKRIPKLEDYPFYSEGVDEATGALISFVGHQNLATGAVFCSANCLFGCGIVDADRIICLEA